MFSRIVMAAVLAVLFAVGAGSGARAQQPNSSGLQVANPSGWTVDIAPYVWFANINATTNLSLPQAVGGGTVSTDTSVGFGQILSHLNFGVMGAADVQYGRFSAVTDFLYMNLGATPSRIRSVNFLGQAPVPVSAGTQVSAGLNLNATIWTLAGGYTVLQGGWGDVTAIAGVRYLRMPVSLNYSLAVAVRGPLGNGAVLGGVGSASGRADIWNGIGGLRGRIRLADTGLFVPYYFDAGAGGSQFTWQIASGLGYHLSWADLSVTYRYLSFQQGGSSVVQHLAVKGPMLMASFAF
ncbi:MAG TPA: hypothetical protein VJY39_20110 [Acidisphaera sp.]|nr:hypothetical protein [Acidisphaera sp.]